MIDIDQQADIISRYGGESGDFFLTEVALVVSSASGGTAAVLGRYRQDTIALLITDDGDDLSDLELELRSLVEDSNLTVPPTDPDRYAHERLTISLGAAQFPDDGFTIGELLDSASRALRADKSRLDRKGTP